MKIKKRYLIAFAALALVFTGCAAQDGQSLESEKQVAEIFKDMPKTRLIEDSDPNIPVADFEKQLERAYSLRLLEGIIREGELPPALRKVIQEHLQNVAPAVKEKFSNVNLDFLLDIIDPRVPLDPALEATLKELLEAEKEKLLLTDIPELGDGSAEEEKSASKDKSEVLGVRAESSDCAQEVYMLYGSGARSCALERLNSLEMLESNYLRREFEAGERYEDRNAQIRPDQLPEVAKQLRDVLGAIKDNITPEEVMEIRSELGYLAATYAYYWRINRPLWKEYSLKLSEWYYLKELQLIQTHRLVKEEEVEEIFIGCIDWVNGLIIEEVDRRCPGDDPILY